MKRTIRNIIGAAIVAGTIAGAASAQEPVELGYNAIEAGYTSDDAFRVRAITNAEIGWLGWSGMNQIEDGYFGRNVFTIGEGKTRIAAVIKGTEDGIFDAKIGVRNTRLPERLGGYGSLDVTLDRDSANATLFYGRALPDGMSIELYQDTEFGRAISHWTELQLNKSLTERLGAYARAEAGDFKDPSFVIGLKLN